MWIDIKLNSCGWKIPACILKKKSIVCSDFISDGYFQILYIFSKLVKRSYGDILTIWGKSKTDIWNGNTKTEPKRHGNKMEVNRKRPKSQKEENLRRSFQMKYSWLVKEEHTLPLEDVPVSIRDIWSDWWFYLRTLR